MPSAYRLPADLQQDLDKFRLQTERFRAGAISAAEYRAFRVPQGVYEQRADGSFMVRVRLPGGVILPEQMRTLAAAARKYASGPLHVTTRQDIQIHNVPVQNIHPALVDLYAGGLAAKGGGGNTVRNITTCPDAGICPHEVFDVTPYALALTEFLLADPASFRLPRKFKISLSGCPQDCAGATVSDLGFIAKAESGPPGFAVYAGGGMGANTRIAELLETFVPAEQIHLVAEALKRVFDQHGNRKNKHRARLRYLVAEKGFEHLRELFHEQLAHLRKDPPAAPVVRPTPRPQTPAAFASPAACTDGFEMWRGANVRSQKQEGYCVVETPLFLGDIEPDAFEKLAAVVERYGQAALRTTQAQNLLLHWVPEPQLAAVHRDLAELRLAEVLPPAIRAAIACTGAATCRLGICLSRNLLTAVRKELERARLDLEAAADLRLYVNGCPNACGRHPIASIGLAGAARRVDGHLVPHYIIQLGGRLGENRTRLAEGNHTLPARSVPKFLVEYLWAFRHSPQYPDFDAFLDADGRQAASEIAARYKEVPALSDDPSFYYDWGAEQPFSLAGRGPGECGAGVFDLIEVDLASARDTLQDGQLLPATLSAARALLITRGEEAREAAEVFRLFQRHFLDTKLLDERFGALIALAADGRKDLQAHKADVAALVQAVEDLYASMDSSLHFQSPAPAPETPVADRNAEVQIDKELDLQGVKCPLNYVKTKLVLETMQDRQVLCVLLDEAGGKNVPESARQDGHEILSARQEGTRWRVIIRKRSKNQSEAPP